MWKQWQVLLLGQNSIVQLIAFCIITIIVAICIFAVIDEIGKRRGQKEQKEGRKEDMSKEISLKERIEHARLTYLDTSNKAKVWHPPGGWTLEAMIIARALHTQAQLELETWIWLTRQWQEENE